MRLDIAKNRLLIAKTGEIVLERCCDLIQAQYSQFPPDSSRNVSDASDLILDTEVLRWLQDPGMDNPDEATRRSMSAFTDPAAAFEDLEDTGTNILSIEPY